MTTSTSLERPATLWARRTRVRNLIWTGLTVAAVVTWVVGPFYFLLVVAFQSDAESLAIPPNLLPAPDLSNFALILSRAYSALPVSAPSDLVVIGITNSAVVSAFVGALNIILSASAGYAFARIRFPGSRSVPIALLGSQMVPPFALLVPYYVVMRMLGLTNTRTGVVIALLSITLPFSVWLMRSYFRNVPLDIERAAQLDGCPRFRVFWRVSLPLVRPGLISVGLFAFMVAWNDFLFAIILNANVDAMLIQPAIAGLYNVREQSFGLMAAGSILAALPTMVFALVTQRFLVRGLLSGSGKA